MRSSHSLDRLDVAFDDDRLVADAGLLLPATLAHHLGLKDLVDEHLDLGERPGRANVGDKLLTLVASALAGGDCIDDAAALQAGGTAGVLGFAVKAASTLGTFLRSFRWGHVRQLDAVTRHLLTRAWTAGAGPGDAPFTIDLDSTICETYGLAKEGALHHGYTHVRGYHPLLAVAAGTGDVLMARLREGRANTVRGAAPIPYWIDGGADVAEISYTPFADRKDATPVRLIVRRVRPTPGSQLAAFVLYDYHAFVTDRVGEMLELEADHRRLAQIEHTIRGLKYRM